jgi:formylglycine-generating enzyme required for sulfatase activity
MRLPLVAMFALLWSAGCGNPEMTAQLPNGATMEFVWIEPGKFTMGAVGWMFEEDGWEGPRHEVAISKGFYLGKFEISQAQWQAVMGTAPWTGKEHVVAEPDHPAVYISWNDMQEFIRRMNLAVGEDLYRLPTEAEWEYACRAGTTTRWSFGDDESLAEDYAWYDKNTVGVGLKHAQPIGTKSSNPWGLYDMHGNVWEWVADWHSGPYPNAGQVDPSGGAAGERRVMRGGGFLNHAGNMRSAKRFGYEPSLRYPGIGARLVRTK